MAEIDMDLLEEIQQQDAEIEREITESVVEPVTTEAKPTEVVVVEDDFDDATPLSPREKLLMERLERVTGEKLDTTIAPITSTTPTYAQREKVFLADDSDIDEVLTKEGINKLLATVYNAALEDASKLSAENIMRGMPATMSQYFAQSIETREMVNEFYKENSDLTPVKKTVAAVANEVSAEHPEFTLEQIMNESAARTRAVLKIKKVEEKVAPVKKATPAFAGQRGSNGRVQVPGLQGLAKDIEDLVS